MARWLHQKCSVGTSKGTHQDENDSNSNEGLNSTLSRCVAQSSGQSDVSSIFYDTATAVEHLTPLACQAGPFTLTLTQRESELFQLLLEFVHDTSKETSTMTILRVSGGWVRDKLLNRGSCDLDIALNNITGVEFATKFNNWLKQSGRKTHKVGVIQKNPEQSKHLETATMLVSGMSLDFVNLRTESYASTSRIPDTVGFGTPLEDAQRRDFTVNSLFYNINENCVEDFSGRGIHDLQCKILSTPIDPLATLKDDPLRFLRGARFASQLGFQLDSAVIRAANDVEVQRALATMVSRPRMGQELEKMFSKGSPLAGLKILCCDAKVGDIIFYVPEGSRLSRPHWLETGIQWVERLESIIEAAANHNHNDDAADDAESVCTTRRKAAKSLFPLLTSSNRRRILILAAFLAELRGECCVLGDGRTVHPLPYYVLVESLRFKKRDAETVTQLLKAADVWSEVLALRRNGKHPQASTWLLAALRIAENFKDSWRVCLGLSIRYSGLQWWREALGMAVILGSRQRHHENPVPSSPMTSPTPSSAGSSPGGVEEGQSTAATSAFELRKQEALDLYQSMCHDNLLAMIEEGKHFFNGNDIIRLFSRLPKGPSIKTLLDYQIQLCIQFPDYTKAQYEDILRQTFSEYL